MDDAQLRTVWQQRQLPDRAMPLAQPLGVFFKNTLAKRYKQVGKLALAWEQVIPSELAEHTALEGYSAGTLRVLADSAAHAFTLETLLAGGLLKALQARSPAPINRVRVTTGQFSNTDSNGAPRYEF